MTTANGRNNAEKKNERDRKRREQKHNFNLKRHGITKERDGRCQKTTRRKRTSWRGEAKKMRRRRTKEER